MKNGRVWTGEKQRVVTDPHHWQSEQTGEQMDSVISRTTTLPFSRLSRTTRTLTPVMGTRDVRRYRHRGISDDALTTDWTVKTDGCGGNRKTATFEGKPWRSLPSSILLKPG
ncbi:hypothetical protein DPEC_G00006940 [Dallia pectoralis]|uniref:Uncharacterized protein n=1 Tax=Dallia pectoralis TaxID=75939 RepID=A0ACC2HKG6_DALPE|nr:hypothetical protein DPEC_G00006940 [Dallia pectoralis]